jgi:hypothetical protein
MTKKNIFLHLSFCILSIHGYSQLEFIPPVQDSIVDSLRISRKNMLLTTRDVMTVKWPSQRIYNSTLQLVNLWHPFPPIWYQIMPEEADGTSFFQDMRIQDNGLLTVAMLRSKSGTPLFSGYIALDTSELNPVDTISSVSYNASAYNIDLHDLRIDRKGRKLFATQNLQTLNAACVSKNLRDTSTASMVDIIIMTDAGDSVLFFWDPLRNGMDVCESYYYRKTDNGLYYDATHCNSTSWDRDGNILYSFKHEGIGKVNVASRQIMWQIGGLSSRALPLSDTDTYAEQHDFSALPDGRYALFSNGGNLKGYKEGLIFEIDILHKTAHVIDRYIPHPPEKAIACGGFEPCEDNALLMSYGIAVITTASRITSSDLIDAKSKELIMRTFLPRQQFTHKAHITTWSPEALRPKIKSDNRALSTDSISGITDYRWYEIKNLKAYLMATGLTFHPDHPGEYVVQGRKGSGYVISYLVSNPYRYQLPTGDKGQDTLRH